MPRPLGTLRVMLSTRVLLDLEEADRIFTLSYNKHYTKTRDKEAAREKAVEAYTAYVCPDEKEPAYDPQLCGRRFRKGPMFRFAEALARLNEATGKPLVEIIISAKDEADSGGVIFRNIDLLASDTLRKAGAQRLTTSGEDLSEELHKVYKTDLLFSRNDRDVQTATDLGIAASTIHFSPDGFKYDKPGEISQVDICFDGDAVAFGSSSEVRYRTDGLEAYEDHEFNDFLEDIEPGPFTDVLAKISQINAEFPRKKAPFRLSLLTARGGSAHSRALAIMKQFGIVINGNTMGRAGADKGEVLEQLRPDLYIDDQVGHLTYGARFCPVGLVHYPTNSPMKAYLDKTNGPDEIRKLREAEGTPVSLAFDDAADQPPETIKSGSEAPAKPKKKPAPKPRGKTRTTKKEPA